MANSGTRNEATHGTDDAASVETHAEENQPPANTVSVEVSTPADDDSGTGGDDPEDEDREDEQIEQLAEITARLETLDNRINDAIKDQREWTTKTITSLQQEVANLKATLQQVTEAMPEQVKALKEELTRLSQELSTAVTETLQIEPPIVPPEGAEDVHASPETQKETSSETANPTSSQRRKRRVI